MTIFIVTFIFFLTCIFLMAIGSTFAKKPLKGSCGGLSAIGMKADCPICGGGNNQKQKKVLKTVKKATFYNASP